MGGGRGLRRRAPTRSTTTGSVGRSTRWPRRWTSIVGSVGARAIAEFGIDVSRLHWDMTSISLFGDYDSVEDGFAAAVLRAPQGPPARTSSRSRPVWRSPATAASPSSTGPSTAGPARSTRWSGPWSRCEKMCGPRSVPAGRRHQAGLLRQPGRHDRGRRDLHRARPRRPTSVPMCSPACDSALPARSTTSPNATAPSRPTAGPLPGRRGRLGPAPASPQGRTGARAAPGLRVVLGRRRRRRHRPGQEAGPGRRRPRRPRPGPRRPPLPDRRRSTPDWPRSPPSAASATTCATPSAPTPPATPPSHWHFDQAALDAEAATDGWYCLLTNLDPAEADAAEVLVRYKGQEVVERRYGDFQRSARRRSHAS